MIMLLVGGVYFYNFANGSKFAKFAKIKTGKYKRHNYGTVSGTSAGREGDGSMTKSPEVDNK